MHKSLLISDVNRIHIHVWIMNPRQILEMHIVGGSNKELLLLLHVDVILTAIVLLLLLLQLHISILILSVRQSMIKTLSMIPGLLCTLLTARSLGSRCMRQLEVIVFHMRIRIGWNGLHV